MSVPPDQMDQTTPANQTVPAAQIRSDLPEVDTSINPDQFASQGVTQLQPPQDIDAAQIGEYTPYEAVQGSVDPDSLVENRMSGLLSRNSDYMQRAKSRANQLSNRRGLMNSSMAVGAAHGAAIDAALPIAQQDASSYGQMNLANLGYSNQAALDAAQASRERENLQAGLEQDTRTFNAQQQFQADQINAAEANKNNFAVLTADLQGQLAGINNELALNMAELESTYSILQNLDSVNGAIYQQMVAEIGTILANVEDPDEAQVRIQSLMAAAGAELEFSTGEPVGGGTTPGGGTTAPPPAPAEEPVNWRFDRNNDPSTNFTKYIWNGSQWIRDAK